MHKLRDFEASDRIIFYPLSCFLSLFFSPVSLPLPPFSIMSVLSTCNFFHRFIRFAIIVTIIVLAPTLFTFRFISTRGEFFRLIR